MMQYALYHTTPMTDVILLARNVIADTDSPAQNELTQQYIDIVHHHAGIINRICLAFSRQASTYDDLRQDALTNIWRGLQSYRGESSITTWLYRIVLNTCVSTIRKEGRHAQNMSIDSIIDIPDADNHADIDHLHRLISLLPPLDRSLILLWLDERPYEEIAEIMGMPRNTIASRLHRAKQKLQTINQKF